MGTGFAKKKKQAKHMQAQMAMLQQSLATKMEGAEIEGSAGNGLVTVTLSGTGQLKRVRIKPECVDPEDVAGLESLIKAAHEQAFKEVQALAEQTPSLEGFPGMGLF